MAQLKSGHRYDVQGGFMKDGALLLTSQCAKCNKDLTFETVATHNYETIESVFVAYCDCGKATYLTTSTLALCAVYDEVEETD